jgi:malate dehydrogenase
VQVVDKKNLEGEFISMIQNRGGAVIKQRGASSAQSAARAIVCHMRDWFLGRYIYIYISNIRIKNCVKENSL